MNLNIIDRRPFKNSVVAFSPSLVACVHETAEVVSKVEISHCVQSYYGVLNLSPTTTQSLLGRVCSDMGQSHRLLTHCLPCFLRV